MVYTIKMIGRKSEIKKTKFTYWMSDPDPVGDKESVLLIHGFGGTYSGLEELADLLAEDNNVLGLDLPGYGLSEPLRGRHTLSNYARFLNEFCDKTEFHKVNVVGHSFGADIAIVFAALYPDRINKLVLITPVIFEHKNLAKLGKFYYSAVAKMPPRLRHKLLHSHMLTWISATINFKQADHRIQAKILRDDYISDHLMTDRPVIESYFSLLSTPFLAKAAKIKAPTLIIAGDKDILSPVQDMQKLHGAISNSRLNISPQSGHLLPIEKPRITYSKIKAFLAEN